MSKFPCLVSGEDEGRCEVTSSFPFSGGRRQSFRIKELQHQISADRGQAGMDFEVTQRSGEANFEKEPQKNTQNGDDQETEKMRNAIN